MGLHSSAAEDLEAEPANWWRESPYWQDFCRDLAEMVQHLPVDMQLATFDILALTGMVEDDYEMRQRALRCPVHGKRQPTLCPICALVECRIRFRFAGPKSTIVK